MMSWTCVYCESNEQTRLSATLATRCCLSLRLRPTCSPCGYGDGLGDSARARCTLTASSTLDGGWRERRTRSHCWARRINYPPGRHRERLAYLFVDAEIRWTDSAAARAYRCRRCRGARTDQGAEAGSCVRQEFRDRDRALFGQPAFQRTDRRRRSIVDRHPQVPDRSEIPGMQRQSLSAATTR